ncbi:MAG: hypothetical protein H6822_16490 [Planctomycetaceae bacterium]|nr:hypothetical protein [Planctomycetales bacterium]MCB9923781.1 hypothetical protein [Planctomycetaceae bacterium]
MRCRILFIVAFTLGLVTLDRLIGFGMRMAYDHTFTGEAGGQINEAIRCRDREVIVFGSSLARHQVDPSVLCAQLSEPSFNAGCNGQDIYYARMLQSLILGKGCASKHFVYILNWRDLVVDDLDRARMFSVFCDESQTIRELLGSSPGSWLKLKSHTYRFNTLAMSTVRQLIAPEYEGHDGFVPIQVEYEPAAGDFADMESDLRVGLTASALAQMSAKLELYRDFSTAARRQNIRVTFVVGPTYRDGRPRGAGERFALEQLQKVAKETGANFLVLDETTVPAFQNTFCFGDPRHLNARGAALFSELLGRCLQATSKDVAKTQHRDDSRTPQDDRARIPQSEHPVSNSSLTLH